MMSIFITKGNIWWSRQDNYFLIILTLFATPEALFDPEVAVELPAAEEEGGDGDDWLSVKVPTSSILDWILRSSVLYFSNNSIVQMSFWNIVPWLKQQKPQ